MIEILISSSVLILVLAILRLVLCGRIDPRLQYALWLLVLVRLLVPVNLFRSPVSVAEAAAPVTQRVEYVYNTILTAGPVTPVERTVPKTVGAEAPDRAVTPAWDPLSAARCVWYAGTAIMAAWFLFVNFRMARRLKKTRRPYGDDGRLPVYIAGGLASPCLFGLFRPAVYLTEQAAADPRQARQIVVHERTHLRHGDLFWALMRSVCLAVWWFDPFVWLAAALSRQDAELACDESTIRVLGEEARFEYGRTLVDMARVGLGKPSDLLCGATTMTTGRRSLKERVARIADTSKRSLIAAAAVVLVAALTAGAAFAGASSESGEPVQTPSPAFTTAAPEPETAFEPTAEEGYSSLASPTDAEVRVRMGLPDQTIQTALREDVEFLYPNLYDVELHDIVLTQDGLTFSIDEAQDKYGFDFRVWYADGTEISGVTVLRGMESQEDISDADVVSFRSRTTYDIYWTEPVDFDRIVRIDNFGCALIPVSVTATVTDRELLDFFTDYAHVGSAAADFETWADYVWFVNDTNREMAEEVYQPYGPGIIYAGEQLSDDLAAFLVWYENDPDRMPVLDFAGRYEGRMYVFRNKELIPEELRDGLGNLTLHDPLEEDENVIVMVPDYDYLDEVNRELSSFAQPTLIDLLVSPEYEAPETDPWTMEDLIYCTDAWQFEYDTEPIGSAPQVTITVYDAEGRTLRIADDVDGLLIREAEGSWTWVTLPGGGLTGADMAAHLLDWARASVHGDVTVTASPEAYAEAQGELKAGIEAVLAEAQSVFEANSPEIEERIAQARLETALEELGSYGLPDREPTKKWAGSENPAWADERDPAAPVGTFVDLLYGSEGYLDYRRLSVLRDDSILSVTDEALEQAKVFYAESFEVGDVKVGPYDGFTCLPDAGSARLTWYDSDRDLLFSLVLFDGGGSAADELIALALTVSPQ